MKVEIQRSKVLTFDLPPMSELFPSEVTIRRCPACGQPVEKPPPPKCPLCAFYFGDHRVTGADVTPYARDFALGRRGWRAMTLWVWLAGQERLKHLALIRSSAASRRFVRINLAMLAVGLGLLQTSIVGWRAVTSEPTIEPTGSTQPAGRGWVHAAATPRPLPPDHPPETRVDFWWNPIQSSVALTGGFLFGLITSSLALVLIRIGVARAHTPAYRHEGRMTAALHYSTAFTPPAILALFLCTLRPITRIAEMERWPVSFDQSAVVELVALLAGLGAALWWFGLIRLGAVAASACRGRVATFYAVGVPVVVCAAGAAWWWGQKALYPWLFKLMHVQF